MNGYASIKCVRIMLLIRCFDTKSPMLRILALDGRFQIYGLPDTLKN